MKSPVPHPRSAILCPGATPAIAIAICLQRRSRPRLIDLRADLEKKQLDLQVAMEDKTADRSAVEKKIEAVETARASLQKTRALMLLDMKQVLKPDQWDRLVQTQQERRERMQERIHERRQMMRENARPAPQSRRPN